MTSIKSTLDDCDANPEKSDLYCQSPFHSASKFGIHKVGEERELMSEWPCLLQTHALSSSALKTQRSSN